MSNQGTEQRHKYNAAPSKLLMGASAVFLCMAFTLFEISNGVLEKFVFISDRLFFRSAFMFFREARETS